MDERGRRLLALSLGVLAVLAGSLAGFTWAGYGTTERFDAVIGAGTWEPGAGNSAGNSATTTAAGNTVTTTAAGNSATTTAGDDGSATGGNASGERLAGGQSVLAAGRAERAAPGRTR